jgi:hypothetical protein
VNEPVRRVPLAEVSDLMAPGEPLPFRVLDAQGLPRVLPEQVYGLVEP